MKTKTLKAGTKNSATPIVAALLAGVALGAVAVANQKKLAAAGTLAAKKVEPMIDGAKSKFGKAVESVTTRMGDIVMNFGEAIDQARKLKIQRLRNPEMTHPQRSGESDRLHAVG